MPVTANTTSTISGTEAWVRIASGGTVLCNSARQLFWAMTPSAASPANDVVGHPFEHIGGGQFQHTIELDAGQHYHVFVSEGADLQVLATDPV